MRAQARVTDVYVYIYIYLYNVKSRGSLACCRMQDTCKECFVCVYTAPIAPTWLWYGLH